MPYSMENKSFFSERLIRKVPDAKELAAAATVAVAALAVCVASAVYLKAFAIIIWAAAAYGAYYVIGAFLFKEYEYILTDNVIDIDLITAKRSRKRLKSIDLKACTEGGKAENAKPGEYLCPTRKSDNLYYLVRKHNGTEETVIIDPNPMMTDAFRCYMGKRFKG